ncbi:MAG: hypothetical protein ACLFVQ_12470 [Chitinispirillaceae bacterium]
MKTERIDQMIELTTKMVEDTWEELQSLDFKHIDSLIEEFSTEQPYVLAYLMATGSDILTEEDRETLVFMGLITWKVISGNEKEVPVVNDQLLVTKEEANMAMLDYLAGEPEAEFMNTVDLIMNKYSQGEFLRFIIHKIASQKESAPSPTRDNVGIVVIYLKTVIDCFDEVV